MRIKRMKGRGEVARVPEGMDSRGTQEIELVGQSGFMGQ